MEDGESKNVTWHKKALDFSSPHITAKPVHQISDGWRFPKGQQIPNVWPMVLLNDMAQKAQCFI